VGEDELSFKNFYAEMMEKAKEWHEVNGWGSRRSQYRRYTNAQEMLGVRNGDCVIDIGSGSGELSQFLWEKGIDVCYHGVDVMEDMVAIAKDRHGDKFKVWDIFEKPIDFRTDWAIAIGTVGALATRDVDKRWEQLAVFLQNMSATTDKGFVFTMLNDRNEHNIVDDHHWFVDPSVAIANVLDMIPSYMGVQIRMDYHPHEMMFAVKRETF
jgi:SAM-dependent methyltransferase